MHKLFHQSLYLVFLLVLSNPLMSAPLKDKVASELLELSGFTHSLSQMPAGIKGGMEEARAKGSQIPAEVFDGLVKIMMDAFDPALLMGPIRNELSSQLTSVDGDKLLAWYNSDLGKRITAAEAKAGNIEALQEIQRLAPQLLEDKRLVGYATRIDKALKSTEMVVELQINTLMAVFTAMVTTAAPNPDQLINNFKNQLAASRPQINQAVHQQVLAASAYSYQDVDDAAMQKYISFLEKPHTERFYQSVFNGLGIAINNSMQSMSVSIDGLLKQHKK